VYLFKSFDISQWPYAGACKILQKIPKFNPRSTAGPLLADETTSEDETASPAAGGGAVCCLFPTFGFCKVGCSFILRASPEVKASLI
jgi:hypothetical protein